MRNRYLSITAGLLVLVGAGSVASLAQKASDGNKPSIEIPRMRQDFGDVFERAQYEYAFVVRNRGTRPHLR
jgi:hypothetical protein